MLLGGVLHMVGSPYRESARAEITFAGEPLVTLHVWVLWGLAVAFVVLAFTVESVSLIRTALLALAVLAGGLLLLWRRAARRVRWRFVLERSSLRLERSARGKSELVGALDVRDGVRMEIDVVSRASGLDLCVALSARGEHITWAPGLRAEIAAATLSKFLRDRDVAVEQPGSG